MAKKQQKSSGGGKASNDTNKMGSQSPTQKNEAQRTPESRQDRQAQVGSDNQTQSRKGGAGSGKGR